MADLTKEQKKEILRKWRADQNKKYLLSKTNVRKLFRYLNKELEKEPLRPYREKNRGVARRPLPAREEGGHPRRDARHGRLL